MHLVYALHLDLREGPDHENLGSSGNRLPDHSGRLQQPDPKDLGQHLLRPVRHSLLHRCPEGPERHNEGLDALAAPEITTVVQIAPAVRVAWAESFGLTGKKAATGKMVAALRRLGFNYVFDTNFSADLTIMEEGSKFLERLTHRDRYHWPMLTSCCPGGVCFLKSKFPHYVDCLSTAKSPQQMFGAVAKTYFAEKIGVDLRRMFAVFIMPCMAKKSECVLSTMRDACSDPDMDAALHSAYYFVTGENPDSDVFTTARGNRPWKEAPFPF